MYHLVCFSEFSGFWFPRNIDDNYLLTGIYCLRAWVQKKILVIIIFVSKVMSLKGMDDRFLLPKDESLTPMIEEAMVVYVF